MTFNSIHFVIFFPIVTLLYFLIPNKFRNIFLLIASYYFYMCWIPKYAVLILFSTIVTYFTAYYIGCNRNSKHGKLLLVLAIIINFAILFVFKYYNFFIDTLMRITRSFNFTIDLTKSNLLLPVGISFYTFQAIGYLIDVYREDVIYEKNFIDYALFVSFFPQLVAGPIERASNLLPQFKEIHVFNYGEAVIGMREALIGMFKKVIIADTIAMYVNGVFNNVNKYNGLSLVFAVFLFSIQIYCDFSGYSNIARGVARVLGFRLMHNFDTPYFSKSISEFWSRWHISLSTWFKDYIYIPLGGNRKGFFSKCFNLCVVFLVSGLWHGADMKFILWGAIHAFYRVSEEIFVKLHKPYEFNNSFIKKTVSLVKIIFTYILVCFAWVFFRANSLVDAKYIVLSMGKNMLDINALIKQSYFALNGTIFTTDFMKQIYMLMIIVPLLILFFLEISKYIRGVYSTSLLNRHVSIKWGCYIALTLMVIVYFAVQNALPGGSSGQFIYFQF